MTSVSKVLTKVGADETSHKLLLRTPCLMLLLLLLSKVLSKVGEDETTQKSLLRTPCLMLCVLCEQYISQTTPM